MRYIIKEALNGLWGNEDAATMTEYGLLIAAIGAGVFGASSALSGSIITFFQSTSSQMGNLN